MQIDPTQKENHDKPLWVVYGVDCFPSLLLCKVNDHATCGPTIWGYSIYKRIPGFRTLGLSLKEWMAREEKPRFFDTQAEAFGLLAKLTTPARNA